MHPTISAWILVSFTLAAALAGDQNAARIQPNSAFGPVDDVYDECGKTMGCFGSKGYHECNTKCLSSKDCDGLVAFRGSEDKTKVNFTLIGRISEDMRYVAVGISADGKMGHDGVVECVHEGDTVNIYRSFNFDHSLGNKRMNEEEQDLITDKSGTFEEGVIKCTFTLPVIFSAEAMNFNLNTSTYHILIAVGTAKKDNVEFHNTAFAASRKPVNLFDSIILECPKNKSLLYVHGICMVLAWIFFASNGIITARYFKKTWVGHRVFNKDIWFRIHQGFMVTAWALTIVGVFCIFAYEKWELEKELHSFVGIVAAVLCFIQPFMAFLRPDLDAPKRVIFNWVHWGVGVSAHILAVTNIFLAFGIDSIPFPVQSYVITGIFVALYVIVHVTLQIHESIISNKGESTESATLTANGDMKTDANGSAFRQTILTFFLMASGVVIALLSTLIVEKLKLESDA